MVCQSCHRLTRPSVCSACRRRLTPAPDRLLSGGVPLVAAFVHSGAARTLIHDLKYRGVERYAVIVAQALAQRLPAVPIVPIPRAWSRTLLYGVDPALVLARHLAMELGVPVLELLSRPIHTPRRAGRKRRNQAFHARRAVKSGSDLLLIDDVVTTGATVLAAGSALGMGRIRMVAAANVVPALPVSDSRQGKRLDLI